MYEEISKVIPIRVAEQIPLGVVEKKKIPYLAKISTKKFFQYFTKKLSKNMPEKFRLHFSKELLEQFRNKLLTERKLQRNC